MTPPGKRRRRPVEMDEVVAYLDYLQAYCVDLARLTPIGHVAEPFYAWRTRRSEPEAGAQPKEGG